MSDYSGYIGYIKVQGPGIENGVLGARESADALLAFDKALRYLMAQKDTAFQNTTFDIPVKVREGSWEALIPTTINDWLIAGGGVFITTATGKVASNTFKEKDVAAVARDSMQLLRVVLRIAKHVGRLGDKKAANGVRFLNNNKEVEIPNKDGIYLRTTREELETYLRMPHKMVEDIIKILAEERTLQIGEIDPQGRPNQETISYPDRKVFIAEEESEEDHGIVLPELVHGEYVEIKGMATRGNKLTNTIGFKYGGHVLTCIPEGAPITAFKEGLFRDCVIKGHVLRSTDPLVRRDAPKIIFQELLPVKPESDQIDIFSRPKQLN
jgi:hypothetical protein